MSDDYIRYRARPNRDEVRRLFHLGIDRGNQHGEEAQLMKHPGQGMVRYFKPYREGIRCAMQNVSYRDALTKLLQEAA